MNIFKLSTKEFKIVYKKMLLFSQIVAFLVAVLAFMTCLAFSIKKNNLADFAHIDYLIDAEGSNSSDIYSINEYAKSQDIVVEIDTIWDYTYGQTTGTGTYYPFFVCNGKQELAFGNYYYSTNEDGTNCWYDDEEYEELNVDDATTYSYGSYTGAFFLYNAIFYDEILNLPEVLNSKNDLYLSEFLYQRLSCEIGDVVQYNAPETQIDFKVAGVLSAGSEFSFLADSEILNDLQIDDYFLSLSLYDFSSYYDVCNFLSDIYGYEITVSEYEEMAKISAFTTSFILIMDWIFMIVICVIVYYLVANIYSSRSAMMYEFRLMGLSNFKMANIYFLCFIYVALPMMITSILMYKFFMYSIVKSFFKEFNFTFVFLNSNLIIFIIFAIFFSFYYIYLLLKNYLTKTKNLIINMKRLE